MKLGHRTTLVSVSALALGMLATAASAQQTTGTPSATPPATASQASTLDTGANTAASDEQIQDIVVTAQRREQNLQDVPIAITAITPATLEANRVTSVQDISGLAPGFTVRPASGGIALPSFTMRGIISYGVVPGSDKEVSVYVDGVYIANPRGSSFELPDIERIEVLRGPQGTLFGRNATAGAVSVTTREPTGIAGARQDFTYGNYNQLRWRTTVDLPAVGPFSAYATYVHDQRDGDIRNLGAGTVWDRTGPGTRTGVEQAAKTLGSKDADEFFGAVRFEPTSTFNMTYKYDHTTDFFSPGGVAPVAYNSNFPLLGNFLTSLFNSQPGGPVQFDRTAERPNAVNNSFAILSRQKTNGHTVIANWRVSDSLSLKNIGAYRTSFINSADNLDGLGGLVFTPQALVPYATFAAFSRNPALATAPAAVQAATIGAFATALAGSVGSRFCAVCNNSQTAGRQWSDEFQATYTNKLFTLTAGALYFYQEDTTGGPPGVANNFQYSPEPNSGRLALGGEQTTRSNGQSIAGYAQAEIHVLPTLDIVAGGRITNDKKTAAFTSGTTFVPGADGSVATGSFTGGRIINSSYESTRPTFSVGANFKPTESMLFYAKYSDAFVSGGSTGGVPFAPEQVWSEEVGTKLDLLNRHVRFNLALYNAVYHNVQSAQSGSNVGHPELSTVIIDFGTQKARGFEAEATVLPIRGVALGGSLSYTDLRYANVNPIIIASQGGPTYQRNYVPAWTAGLNGQYEIAFVHDTKLVFRSDATYQSRRPNIGNPIYSTLYPALSPYFNSTEPYWIANGRVSIRDIRFGPANFEIAGWVKNFTQTRAALYPLGLGNIVEATDFVPARTYGIDLSVRFR